MKKNMKWTKKRKAMLCAMVSSALLFQMQGISFAAEPEEFTFDQIVVTATKVQQKTKDIPASVTVITAQDIAKLNVQSIDQALIRAAGVSDGRSTGISSTVNTVAMRGFGSASETLVMVDGQPLNDAYSGGVTWSNIPVNSVERIEIVRGPGSTLYGSQAMGGVINIITKNPQKAEASISTRWETNNTQIHRIDISDKLTDKLSFRLDYEKKSTDGYEITPATVKPSKGAGTAGVTGWKPNTTNVGGSNYIVGDTGKAVFDEENYGVKFLYQFDENRKLTMGFLHNKWDRTYESPHNFLTLNGVPFTGKVNVGGGNIIAVDAKTFWSTPAGRETNIYTMGYNDKKDGWTLNAGFTDNVHSYNLNNYQLNGTARMKDSPNSRMSLNLQKEIRFDKKDLAVFGMYYGKDKMTSTDSYLSNWRDYGSKTSLYGQAAGNAHTIAFFGQNEHKFNDKLSLTAGLRYDKWSTDGMTKAGPTVNPWYYSERSDSAVSPKLALQYSVDKSSSMYVSWGKAFQAPDLYRIYSSSIVSGQPNYILTDPNPNLKPQKVTTVEFGGKKKFGEKTNVSLTYFHNDITDISYKRTLGTIFRDGTTYTQTRYENAGEGTTNGVEMEINQKFDSVWSGFLNYTWQRPILSKNSADPSLEGKLITLVPQQMLKVGIDYQKDKWHGLLTGNYVSKRYYNDDNSDTVNGVYGSYDPYFIANMSLEYQWDKHNSIMLGIDNLLDRQYFNYYVAPGRTYAVQVTHKF